MNLSQCYVQNDSFNSVYGMSGMDGLSLTQKYKYYFGNYNAALEIDKPDDIDYVLYNMFYTMLMNNLFPVLIPMFDVVINFIYDNHVVLLLVPYVLVFFYMMFLSMYDKYQVFSVSSFLISLPVIGTKIRKKLKKITVELEDSLACENGDVSYNFINDIPLIGKTMREVAEMIDSMTSSNDQHQYHFDKISGVVYLGDKVHDKKCLKLFDKFSSTNPLHPDLFPQIRNMEIDIINMVSQMFYGDEHTCGNITYGGTESILLACLTYRDYGRREKNIFRPNIVAFDSVHPAFDKACHYFNIELRKINSYNYDDFSTFQYSAVKKLLKPYIDENTVCIVGSAPNYSYGLIDPIWGMSKVAIECGVGFHVDACMGGFLIPFLPEFNWINFTVPGITSISVDTHKYGYSFKGSSVLLFKSHKYKQYQHFIQKDWNGGIYATPTMMGSKSGGLIAATWGSLLFTGRENYIKYANTIQNNTLYIYEYFKGNPLLLENINIVGKPELNILAFVSNELNIYLVLDAMKKKGWNLSVMQNPAAFHLCITNLHTRENCKLFCENMVESVEECLQNENKKLTGTLALYGSSTQLQNSIFLEEIINNYIMLLSKRRISQKYE